MYLIVDKSNCDAGRTHCERPGRGRECLNSQGLKFCFRHDNWLNKNLCSFPVGYSGLRAEFAGVYSRIVLFSFFSKILLLSGKETGSHLNLISVTSLPQDCIYFWYNATNLSADIRFLSLQNEISWNVFGCC